MNALGNKKAKAANILQSALFLAVLLYGAGPGLAATVDPQQVLQDMDDGMNAAEDETFEFEVTTVEKGKSPRTLVLVVYTKGEKRMTEFLAPGDMKGTKALTLSPTQIYVYLPEYKKIRRVASHVSRQGFMGTAYSQADMALTRYSPAYIAEMAAEDETSWTLNLTRREGAEAPYAKIECVVDKKVIRPLVMKYFNEDGVHSKTERREEYSCQGPNNVVCNGRLMKMIDHSKADMTTTFIRRKWSVNDGLKDSKFSKRRLQSAR